MRLLLCSLLIGLLCACADTPEKKPPEDTPSAISKIGVVGLVQQRRERAINEKNWKDAIVGIIRNEEQDKHANVSRVVYEVTVFYDAGEQEVIHLDQDPQLRPGQRVRVTGKKIDVLPPR
jgi:hypothetical protein